MKYIFVTGGVVSGLGKGICAASLGRLLKQCGLRVKNQKFDPYLNVDLGHYERFVDEALNANASVSSGKVYWSVLNRERQGGYLGGTVQIIPHVTDEIKSRVYAMDDGETDVCITEIGGTVGDIESQPSGRGGKRERKRPLYPRSAHRLHPRQRRAQEQAHAAFRQGAALPRHPAGYPRLPHGQPAARRCAP